MSMFPIIKNYQAGAELCQALVKLKVIVETKVEGEVVVSGAHW